MIPYSRPKLYDFYTLSQTYLLENHTLHSKFTAARIYCTACIWQPLGYAPGHTVAISRKHSPHGDFYKTPSNIFTMYLPPSPCGIWLIIAQSFGVLFSFPPSHLGGFSQVLGLFIKDAQTDLLTCFWLRCEEIRGIIKFSCWTTALQHKVPSERAFKVGWMGGGGLKEANVLSRFLHLIIKTWPLRIIKDGKILIRINYK